MRNHGIRILLNARIQGLFAAAVCCIAIPFQTLSAATYFYHNDHLGTPQVLTDKNQQVVWQGKQEPFGENSPSTSLVEQNLRLPGQYYDQESSFHYNYQRTYDPSTGRYVTSDPIGLHGGLSTYTYAFNNPVGNSDPSGLITCVFITRSDSGFGNHAGLYGSRGGAGGAGWYYDPAGGYGGETRPGGGLFDEVYDSFDIIDYAKYHEKYGDTVHFTCKDTAEKEEKDFFQIAEDLGEPIGISLHTNSAGFFQLTGELRSGNE